MLEQLDEELNEQGPRPARRAAQQAAGPRPRAIEFWLDGALLADGARLGAGVSVVLTRRDVV